MINKQKLWFITLFSLILVLSVYYITMPSELLTAAPSKSKKNISKNVKEVVTETDLLTALQVELDEERTSLTTAYNEVIANEKSTLDEKNDAYDGLKKIDELKSNEEKLEKKIKNNLKLKSFIKIDGSNISVTIQNKEHDYSLANEVMRLIQEEYKNKIYITVKFQK